MCCPQCPHCSMRWRAPLRATPAHLASLQVAISGGAALNDEVRNAFAQNPRPFWPRVMVSPKPPLSSCCAALRVPSKPMSIGLPLPATDIRFVGVDSGEVVGIGEDGELQVRGPTGHGGYYKRRRCQRRSLHGWMAAQRRRRSHRRDGYVFLVDRIKGPHHLLRASMSIPDHRGSADDPSGRRGGQCHRRADEYRGEAPVAFVKLKSGRKADQTTLKAFLHDKLNKIEMPARSSQGRPAEDPHGKLSKKELREEYARRKRTRSDPSCRSGSPGPLRHRRPRPRVRHSPPRAIRFYESKGLLRPPNASARPASSARRDRARLILILRGKRLGFSLRDISDYSPLRRRPQPAGAPAGRQGG